MRPANFFSNSFFQFIIITLINFGLGGGLFILSTLLGYVPDADTPLGASNEFIFYDNCSAVWPATFFRKHPGSGRAVLETPPLPAWLHLPSGTRS